MKETEQHYKDEVVAAAEVQQEKQLKYLGSLRPHPGHKVYELNMVTGELKEAEFKLTAAKFEDAINGKLTAQTTVITKEKCLYTCALNEKNAKKHFRRMLGWPNPKKRQR